MAVSGQWEPKIVAFLCNWCSYAGADLAGTSRIQYPPNVRIIRVPCSGRVDPFFILAGLQKGVDGVLVGGCHPGECHYLTGNYSARRKFALLKGLLEFAGIEEGRVQFTWVSASEGVRFAKVIEQVTARIRSLGPSKRLVKDPPQGVMHAAAHD
jgi:coenzyme F420-reducing hydrogenase delta subunit